MYHTFILSFNSYYSSCMCIKKIMYYIIGLPRACSANFESTSLIAACLYTVIPRHCIQCSVMVQYSSKFIKISLNYLIMIIQDDIAYFRMLINYLITTLQMCLMRCMVVGIPVISANYGLKVMSNKLIEGHIDA